MDFIDAFDRQHLRSLRAKYPLSYDRLGEPLNDNRHNLTFVAYLRFPDITRFPIGVTIHVADLSIFLDKVPSANRLVGKTYPSEPMIVSIADEVLTNYRDRSHGKIGRPWAVAGVGHVIISLHELE